MNFGCRACCDQATKRLNSRPRVLSRSVGAQIEEIEDRETVFRNAKIRLFQQCRDMRLARIVKTENRNGNRLSQRIVHESCRCPDFIEMIKLPCPDGGVSR